MKILCDVTIQNRLVPSNKKRNIKATLACGYHPPGKKESDLFLILFTTENKSGTRYKVTNNLNRIFTRFIDEGKVTISFKDPENDLQIHSDATQLKLFLKTLKLAIDNKDDYNKTGLSTLAVTAVPKSSHPTTKFTITKRSQYPLKGFPRTLQILNINGIKRFTIDRQILYLKCLTTLNLSDNCITKIPEPIGDLKLKEINFSNNNLGDVNKGCDWKWLRGAAIQQSIQCINLSKNNLTGFPYNLINLRNLVSLNISDNLIKKIPFSIRKLQSLRILNLSNNLLESLPTSLELIKFQSIDISANHFKKYNNIHDRKIPQPVLSLFELAARYVDNNRIPYSSATIPWTIVKILQEMPLCICGTLSLSAQIHEKGSILQLNCDNVIKNENQIIYTDCAFCSSKCASDGLSRIIVYNLFARAD